VQSLAIGVNPRAMLQTLLYFLIELVSFAFIFQAQIGPRAISQFNQSATFLLRFIPSRLQLSHDAADVSDTAR